MVNPYRFQVEQRVRIHQRGGGNHRQPSESARGMLGVIAPQMTDDWAGTKLELEAGIPNVYYVTLDSGTTEIIAEDWLETAPADAPPPPAPQSRVSQLKRGDSMDFGLTDKKAFVGGASRGIGKAIALELAREGCDVVVASRTMTDLETSAQEIAEATGRNIIPIAMDATDTEQVNRVMAEAAERLGGLHILVNSASLPGGSADAIGPIDTVNEDSLISDFDVKYVGALRSARAAIPFLKEQGWGRIVNISGGNGRTAGNLSGGARNVSMVHMTKTLAIQLGRFGITVNCIHPGTTRTERTPGLLEARAAQLGIPVSEVEAHDFAPDSPRGNHICRMVDGSEIGYLTCYLASDKAWAVTGEVIAAGGGTGAAVYY